ncbi:MAG: hypothetical protein ACK475_07440 [Bacteroidota bacterium]|jgi:hypothetical protein
MACFAQYSTAQLVTMASIKLLELNPMGFPPTDKEKDTCIPNYRVVKGACWGKKYYNNGSYDNPDYMHRAIACPTNATCCVDYFEVCMVNRKRVATPRVADPDEIPLPLSTVCNDISLTPGSVDVIYQEALFDCHPVCGPVPPTEDP